MDSEKNVISVITNEQIMVFSMLNEMQNNEAKKKYK